MELQLATKEEMINAIEAIRGIASTFKKITDEHPEKVAPFAKEWEKAFAELYEYAKDRAIKYQETYWELSGGYSLRLTQKASYDYSYSPEWLLAKAHLKEVEETLKLEIDLQHKKGGSPYKKMSEVYTLVTPK